MDVLAGTVISSIESATITMYHSVLMYFHLDPYSRHEGFSELRHRSQPRPRHLYRHHPRLSEYPLEELDLLGRGEGGDDVFNLYKPYLRQTEHSSRKQRDNHKWPTSKEMLGPLEQTLRTDIVLPCNYPTPGLSGFKTYASFA